MRIDWRRGQRQRLRLSTQSLLLIGMVISALIPSIFVNIYYFNRFNANAEEEHRHYNESVVEQTAGQIKILLNQLNTTSRQLIASSISSDTLQSYYDMNPAEKINVTRKYQKLLKDIDMSVAYHAHIFLVGNDNMVYQGINKLDTDGVVRDMDTVISGVPYYTEHFSDLPATQVIPFIMEPQNYYGYNLIGKIVIELAYSDLEEIFEGVYLGKGSEIAIVNDEDYLIYYQGDEDSIWKDAVGQRIDHAGDKPFTPIENFEEYRYDIGYFNWTLIAYIGQDKSVWKGIALPSITLLIGCIFFAFIYSYFVSRGISKPLKKLMYKMRHLKDASLVMQPIETGNRDIEELSQSFDNMIQQIEELTRSMIIKEKENVEIKYKSLQAQINPHFLYNTLDVIRSIALDYNANSIEEIARYLALMFRYSISSSDGYVLVKDEMEHVKNYINIQKYRFGEKIQVIYAVDQGILGYKMIKFILQPIIENAFLHGLDHSTGQGVITIIGQKKQDILEFKIVDNGIGIGKEKLMEIQRDLTEHRDYSKGIGLTNVDSRLRMYYGDDFGLRIMSSRDEGTQITVCLPAKGE